jgi:hypothetical protein
MAVQRVAALPMSLYGGALIVANLVCSAEAAGLQAKGQSPAGSPAWRSQPVGQILQGQMLAAAVHSDVHQASWHVT